MTPAYGLVASDDLGGLTVTDARALASPGASGPRVGFGPKGVASMLFALFVLKSEARDRSVVFDVAAFVILASIAAHGLTDTARIRVDY